MPRADYPLSDYKRFTNHVGKSRLLANFLREVADAKHARGNDAETLQNLRRILVISRVDSEGPLLISHLVSVAIRSLAAASIEHFEPLVNLKNPAAAAEAMRLLATLQEDDYLARTLPLSMEGEMSGYSANLASQFPTYQSWWIKPLANDALARNLIFAVSTLPALRARNWQQVEQLFPAWPFDQKSLLDEAAFQLQDDSLSYSTKRVIELHMRSIADGRAAILLLAARLYTATYGALPQNSSVLVPKFISRVPPDPFSLNNDPLHYRPDSAGPTVWSVGENGTDEGGRELFDAEGVKLKRYGDGSRSSNNSPDMVYGAAWRMATAPARIRKAPGNVSPAPPVN